MLIPHKKDITHKVHLLRLLTEIADNGILSHHLAYKGGTAAALLGYLDRFSVDLDFDLIGDFKDIKKVQKELETIFKNLNLRTQF